MKLHPVWAAMLLYLCTSCDPASTRLRQFQVQGERLYQENCSNCHQPDGSGLARLYPPVNDPNLLQHADRIVCAIRYGVNGPITIGGKTFDQPMVAVDRLSDLEIAEIITYMTTTWGGWERITEPDSVRLMSERCR